MDEEPMMKVPEVAALLRCHVATVYRLVRQKQLPGFQVGSDWRFPRALILELIARDQTGNRAIEGRKGRAPKKRQSQSLAQMSLIAPTRNNGPIR